MAYNFADLKSELKTEIGDPNASDTILGNALNNAEQDIFNTFELTLNSAQTTNTLAASANTLTSALPSDLQTIRRLYITSPSGSVADLTPYFLTVDDFRYKFPVVNTSSIPTYWTFWDEVEFSVLADQAYTIGLDYTKSVSLMSDTTDVPTVPQSFKEMLMLGAKIRIYEAKEDFDFAAQFKNRFATLQENFITRYGGRQVDRQIVVSNPRRG